MPGAWHVRAYEDTTHFGLVDYLWQLHTSDKTRLFWGELGRWLRTVDEAAGQEQGEGVKDANVSIAKA